MICILKIIIFTWEWMPLPLTNCRQTSSNWSFSLLFIFFINYKYAQNTICLFIWMDLTKCIKFFIFSQLNNQLLCVCTKHSHEMCSDHVENTCLKGWCWNCFQTAKWSKPWSCDWCRLFNSDHNSVSPVSTLSHRRWWCLSLAGYLHGQSGMNVILLSRFF